MTCTPCTPQYHITEVLKDLHWLPVKKRVIFKILLLTYKCVNNLSPKYLCELLSPGKCPRPLRRHSLQLLGLLQTRLESNGNRSFAYGAVLEGNMLPLHIRQSPSVKIFKTNLKTYLFFQNSKHDNWKLAQIFEFTLSSFAVYFPHISNVYVRS